MGERIEKKVTIDLEIDIEAGTATPNVFRTIVIPDLESYSREVIAHCKENGISDEEREATTWIIVMEKQ